MKSQEQIGCRVAELQTAAVAPLTSAVVSRLDKSKVVCYRCNKPGHFARECRSPRPMSQKDTRPDLHSSTSANPFPNSPTRKCARCRSVRHEVRGCSTGPPKRPCFCELYIGFTIVLIVDQMSKPLLNRKTRCLYNCDYWTR